jgi:hypothetical protein
MWQNPSAPQRSQAPTQHETYLVLRLLCSSPLLLQLVLQLRPSTLQRSQLSTQRVQLVLSCHGSGLRGSSSGGRLRARLLLCRLQRGLLLLHLCF